MQAEQVEVSSFLSQHRPFDELPVKARDVLAQSIEIAYFQAGAEIVRFRDAIEDLHVVRSGSVEVFRRNGELHNRLAEGGIFGQMGLLMNGKVRFPVKALDDTLVYCIPDKTFKHYCAEYDDFADYFEADEVGILRGTVSRSVELSDLTTVKVKTILTRPPVIALPDMTVQQAARYMGEQDVSFLLVCSTGSLSGESESGLKGILTDHHLRQGIVADGLPLTTPISDVMSSDFKVLDSKAYMFEAMLMMLRFNLQQLPVMHRQEPIGALTLSDILRHESQSSLLFVKGIFAQPSVKDLTLYAKQLPAVYVRMVNEDANSHMIGTAMAVIGRSIKQHLLSLAEEKFGPPPVPYCFLALGSMARDEQLLVTDQDNALLFANGYRPKEHEKYFAKLAKYVCDGLAACGYTYCSGDIMATNPQWRRTFTQWQECFADWIDNPEPQALLNSSIFFDLDGVWGETSLADTLKTFVAQRAKSNPRFLASLARNALGRTPPLGFFKNFVMEPDGRHGKSINLKRRGTAPLSDVIRVHALAVGSNYQNSFERLDDIIEAGILPDGKGRELSDALEYISMVRIRHQAHDIEQNETPDNTINPKHLSTFEKRNLREAFQILDKAQQFLKYRYTAQSSLK
ncbi:MAG: CBS domain-containing protein [Cellvibrionaceae bacterium]